MTVPFDKAVQMVRIPDLVKSVRHGCSLPLNRRCFDRESREFSRI